MNVKELRIGNWVSYCEDANRYKDYHQVTNIDEGVAYCHNRVVDPELFPIPLTGDILIKCGFKKYKSTADRTWKMNRNGKAAFELRQSGVYTLIWFDADDDYGHSTTIKCEYLHQLQNLYFALTGNELNYVP